MLQIEITDPDGARRLVQAPDDCVIGKGRDSEVRLDSWRVGREHARLFRTPGLVDRVQRTNQRLSERLDGPPHLSDPLQPGRPAERVNQAVPALPPAPPAARAQTDTATE